MDKEIISVFDNQKLVDIFILNSGNNYNEEIFELTHKEILKRLNQYKWQPIETMPKDGTKILRYHVLWKCILTVSYKPGASILPNFDWITGDCTNSYPEQAFEPKWMPQINI